MPLLIEQDIGRRIHRQNVNVFCAGDAVGAGHANVNVKVPARSARR